MADFRAGKPSFRVKQSVAQVLVAGTNTLTFDVLDFEEPAGWDGTSTYLLDRPGLYLVLLQVGRSAVGTSSSLIGRIVSQATAQQSFQSLSTTAGVVVACSALLHLEAGDSISANVTAHATLPATTTPTQTFLSATRVGPKRWT